MILAMLYNVLLWVRTALLIYILSLKFHLFLHFFLFISLMFIVVALVTSNIVMECAKHPGQMEQIVQNIMNVYHYYWKEWDLIRKLSVFLRSNLTLTSKSNQTTVTTLLNHVNLTSSHYQLERSAPPVQIVFQTNALMECMKILLLKFFLLNEKSSL